MLERYHTKGFVFKEKERTESDKILTVFSQDFGKIKLLGKGIRKIASKLRGNIPILSISEIEFIQGRGFKTLTDSGLSRDFDFLKTDIDRLGIAYQIADTLDRLIIASQKELKIWQLLNETFQYLDEPKIMVDNIDLIYDYFLWNLLSVLGYCPRLYQCLKCKKRLKQEKLYFSLKGGIVCADCHKEKESIDLLINPNIIKVIRCFLKKDIRFLNRLRIGSEYQASLKRISISYFNFLLS